MSWVGLEELREYSRLLFSISVLIWTSEKANYTQLKLEKNALKCIVTMSAWTGVAVSELDFEKCGGKFHDVFLKFLVERLRWFFTDINIDIKYLNFII